MKSAKLYMVFLTAGYVLTAMPAMSYDLNESIGKSWQMGCKQNKEKTLFDCCTEKANQCNESAKDDKTKEDCSKKFDSCKIETTTFTQQKTIIPGKR